MTARVLTRGEQTAVSVVGGATAVLGALGFLNSFARVAHAAEPSFGRLSWTVPLGIDLGIAVFSALDIVLARMDLRVRWLRLLPWSLTAATVYLNIAGEHTLFGRVAHAVLPGLWVVAVEVAAHTIKTRVGLLAGTRMDRIRRSRWLLAPRTTLSLWRRMVLWEVTSYPEALARERARLLALTDLQDTYGRWTWRWKAPRRARALYRLGEHTTQTGTTTEPAAPMVQPAEPDPVGTPADTRTDTPPAPRTGTPRRARTGRRTAGRRGGRTGARTDTELTALLADVPRDPDGTVPVRRAAAALGCGVDRARRLLTTQGLLRTADAPPTNDTNAGDQQAA